MFGNEKTRSPLAPIGASLRRVYAPPALGRLLTMVMTAVAALTVVIGYSGVSIAAPKNVVVNCGNPNASIQDAVDSATGPTRIRFMGLCEEDVTITKDDITLDGQDTGTVSGTITFDGAHRGVLMNSTVTGPGIGVIVVDGASAKLKDNIIDGKESYGVIVSQGSFLRFEGNIVTDNGRTEFFEAGISVGRGSTVRAQGNVYSNNRTTGVEVFNFATYRTGSFILGDDREIASSPDNDGPFEVITASNVPFALAVGLGQMSFGDFRQVLITGNVNVGRKSMLQIRGDNFGDNKACSQIDGNLNATQDHAQVRITFTHVTGAINSGGPDLIDGGSTLEANCPNLPLVSGYGYSQFGLIDPSATVVSVQTLRLAAEQNEGTILRRIAQLTHASRFNAGVIQ